MTMPKPEYNTILCRYSEIALKGANRGEFEERLINSLRRVLKDIPEIYVINERGRLFIRPKGGDRALFPAEILPLLQKRLPLVFGLASASLGLMVKPELETIEEAVMKLFPPVYAEFVARRSGTEAVQYCTKVRRSWKDFPLDSREVEIHFAEKLLKTYPRLEINLKQPELCIEIEIRRKRAMVLYDRIPGPGGLPAGSSGRVLALLSGGIDSPVACWLALKRGCRLDYLTFHSTPYTPPALITKVAKLAAQLNRYQKSGTLTAVNLLQAQKIIRDNCSPRYRTVLYRRLMFRVAKLVAAHFGAEALVTGENLGQVASQTMTNLQAIQTAVDMLVLRPLLTADKDETKKIAEKIGTLSLSEETVPDSCSVFAPKKPHTAVDMERLLFQEASLDMPALISECLSTACWVNLRTYAETPLMIEAAHE